MNARASLYPVLLAALLLFLVPITAGCVAAGAATRDGATAPAAGGLAGTVTFVPLEGGFYGIVADDGARYDPTNLPPELRQDGLRVRFRGQPNREIMTIRMWGTPYDLQAIEKE